MPHVAAVIQSYTVRIPGHCYWRDGITDYATAQEELRSANLREPGHRIYATWTDGSVTEAPPPVCADGEDVLDEDPE